MKKLCHIIGFPIISKLIRGHTVELDNVCFIPDDQLLNESKELYGCLVEPQNTDTKDDSQNVNQQLKDSISDLNNLKMAISCDNAINDNLYNSAIDAVIAKLESV